MTKFRLVDCLKPEAVYADMRERNIKVFGSFERCKDRLQRFYDIESQKTKRVQYEVKSGPKVVHIETIPVINDSDKKIIHVEVNTTDVLDIANSLLNLKQSALDSLIDKYRRYLLDATMFPELETNLIESHRDWILAHAEFIQNGFVSFQGMFESVETMKDDDEDEF